MFPPLSPVEDDMIVCHKSQVLKALPVIVGCVMLECARLEGWGGSTWAWSRPFAATASHDEPGPHYPTREVRERERESSNSNSSGEESSGACASITMKPWPEAHGRYIDRGSCNTAHVQSSKPSLAWPSKLCPGSIGAIVNQPWDLPAEQATRKCA